MTALSYVLVWDGETERLNDLPKVTKQVSGKIGKENPGMLSFSPAIRSSV